MRKFMLCTLFCISLLFLVPEMQAQALKSEMKIIEGTEYMVPNIDVLVYFLTCDMKEWEWTFSCRRILSELVPVL